MKRIKSKEDVEEYYRGDKIECLICGKLFKSLGTHIIKIHNVSVDEYKQKFNLPWSRGLISEKSSKKFGEILLERAKKDKRLKMTPEVMAKAQTAKKRDQKDYDIERLVGMGEKILSKHKKNTYENAIKILEMAEELKCPIRCVCALPGMPYPHNVHVASKSYPEIKKRYEKLKKEIPRGVELELGLSHSELKKQIVLLHDKGSTHREIAKKFYISTTTVNRALNNKGVFKEE